jgi:hypothetical protein
MSTKVFSVASDKVQAIVKFGLDAGLAEDLVVAQVLKQHSGFMSVKLYDDTTKDVSALVYADLIDQGTAQDILIASYVKSPEYAAFVSAWDALDSARSALVAIIDPESGIGVRSMMDRDLFVAAPGGGGRRAYAYNVGDVWTAPQCPQWGVKILGFEPVYTGTGDSKELLHDKKTGKQVFFVNRCAVVANDDKQPKPRLKEFSSLSSAVAYVQKRWAEKPYLTRPGKDGDNLADGNCPRWLGIPFA